MKRGQNGSRRRAPVQQAPSTTRARGSVQTRRSTAFPGATPAEHRGSCFSARTTEGGGNHGGRARDAFTRALSLPGAPAPFSDALLPPALPSLSSSCDFYFYKPPSCACDSSAQTLHCVVSLCVCPPHPEGTRARGRSVPVMSVFSAMSPIFSFSRHLMLKHNPQKKENRK